VRLLADEDFDNDVLRGLRRRVPQADVVLLAECSHEGEWEGQVRYVPM
jgi:hypothetical protein